MNSTENPALVMYFPFLTLFKEERRKRSLDYRGIKNNANQIYLGIEMVKNVTILVLTQDDSGSLRIMLQIKLHNFKN